MKLAEPRLFTATEHFPLDLIDDSKEPCGPPQPVSEEEDAELIHKLWELEERPHEFPPV